MKNKLVLSDSKPYHHHVTLNMTNIHRRENRRWMNEMNESRAENEMVHVRGSDLLDFMDQKNE